MTNVVRYRQTVTGSLNNAEIDARAREGWKLVALEWEREQPTGGPAPAVEVPFGLRVAGDCRHLEEDPIEFRALMLMMEQIVLDLPLSTVAEALNDAGIRTRQGLPWDRISVFNMLPRLIEVGPRMFSTEEWRVRRRSIFKVA